MMLKSLMNWLKDVRLYFDAPYWKKRHDALRDVAAGMIYERDKKFSDMQAYYMRMIGLYKRNLESQLPEKEQFTQEELRSLVQLVHPDKHGGKATAIRMTQKINALRK